VAVASPSSSLSLAAVQRAMERPSGGSPGLWDPQTKQRQLAELRQSLLEHEAETEAATAAETETQSEASWSQDAQQMPAAVREALVRVLWEAVHAQRSLFGRTCRDVPSFFDAADRSSTGHLSRSELREAFIRSVSLCASEPFCLFLSLGLSVSLCLSVSLPGWTSD
jgi:hypothetical protein